MKIRLAFLVALLAGSAQADDMQQYMRETKEFIAQGNYQEALDRHRWFHRHALEHDSGMSGVRLSFALSDWQALAKLFPPAQAALVELQASTNKQALENNATFAEFHDASALNRALNEEGKTVQLFKTLDQSNPKLAKSAWHVAKGSVIAAKEFDLAAKYIGNPAREFARAKESFERLTELTKDQPLAAQLRASRENSFVEECLQLIQVALAMKDTPGAKDVQDKALAVVDDYRLRNALPVAPEASP